MVMVVVLIVVVVVIFLYEIIALPVVTVTSYPQPIC